MSMPRRRPQEQELDKEIAFHLDQLIEANIARGLSPTEARRQALLDFGGPTQVKQSIREIYLSPLLDAARFHLHAVLRFLRHTPGFSLAVIVTLALGIGANSAIFSVLDAIVLRPLPYPASNQLVLISQRNQRNQDANRFVAPIRLEDWNRLNTTFQAISGSYKDDLTETSGPIPERLTEAYVAPRFLTVMGVSPLLGRDFLPAEEHFGGPFATIISYRLWKRRFNGDPGVLGKQLHVGSFNLPIVGVMPPSFLFPDREVDLWAPSPPDAPYAQDRNSTWFSVVGRLKPGVTTQAALANLNTVQRQLGIAFPRPDADLQVDLAPMKDSVIGGIRDSLWVLYGSVSLLLLIACSNIAALLLARTAEREHEISVHFSLGASRHAIIAQLLAEVFALALSGSALGLCVAAGALQVFHRLAVNLPRTEEIALNWHVALYSLLCAVATTVLCGLYPAFRGTRRQLAQTLAANARTQTSSRSSLQWLLVGIQVCLAVVLLTGASLLVRSLRELGRVSPGFDPSHVLTFQISGSYGETTNMGRVLQRINNTLDSLRSMPGIEAAATSSSIPGVFTKYQLEYQRDGQTAKDHPILADGRLVSASYFTTMGIPLLVGKDCGANSTGSEILINRSFAERYFPNGASLGHTLNPAADRYLSQPGRIIGIVADARESGLNQPPQPTVYTCFSAPGPAPLFLVRTKGNPSDWTGAIRRRVLQLQPQRSVYAMVPLSDQLQDQFSDDRLRTLVLASFAAMAVLLACIGLYGTLSYLGRTREQEVGLRLVLGATRTQVASLFLIQGALVAACGCVSGALASLLFSRLLTSMLFGISPVDLSTYAGVFLFTLTAALLACVIPARRAALVEPNRALRSA